MVGSARGLGRDGDVGLDRLWSIFWSLFGFSGALLSVLLSSDSLRVLFSPILCDFVGLYLAFSIGLGLTSLRAKPGLSGLGWNGIPLENYLFINKKNMHKIEITKK